MFKPPANYILQNRPNISKIQQSNSLNQKLAPTQNIPQATLGYRDNSQGSKTRTNFGHQTLTNLQNPPPKPTAKSTRFINVPKQMPQAVATKTERPQPQAASYQTQPADFLPAPQSAYPAGQMLGYASLQPSAQHHSMASPPPLTSDHSANSSPFPQRPHSKLLQQIYESKYMQAKNNDNLYLGPYQHYQPSENQFMQAASNSYENTHTPEYTFQNQSPSEGSPAMFDQADIQKFIDFYNKFSQHQAMGMMQEKLPEAEVVVMPQTRKQQYHTQRPPIEDLPKPQNQHQVITSQKQLPPKSSSKPPSAHTLQMPRQMPIQRNHMQNSSSSDSSTKNLEQMIAAMKQDVLECKQWMSKERYQSSDRNVGKDSNQKSSNEKQLVIQMKPSPVRAEVLQDPRGKSQESKSSTSVKDTNSYKRKNKNNLNMPTLQNKKNVQRSDRNMPDQIFKLDSIPEEEKKETENFSIKASASMDRKGAKQEAIADSQIQKDKSRVQAYKTKQEMMKMNKRQQENHAEEAGLNVTPKNRNESRAAHNASTQEKKQPQGGDARQQPALQSEQPPQRQNLDAGLDDGENYEFTNLNIKGNVSESDDEREQRIFQFSPLSSKKQHGEEGESSEQEDDQHEDNQNNAFELILRISSERNLEDESTSERLRAQQSEQTGPRRDIYSMVANNNDYSMDQQHNLIDDNPPSALQQTGIATASFFRHQNHIPSSRQSQQSQIVQEASQIEYNINQNMTTIFEQEQPAAPVKLETKHVQTEDKAFKVCSVQTEEDWPDTRNQVRNLSPFETYDFLFIRDLINNLNYDNEVLHDNSEDLKGAFMFLLNKHKQLQFEYEKQKRNEKLVEMYAERLEVCKQEKDDALLKAGQMAAKVELLNDIIQVSVAEQAEHQKEDTQLIESLANENIRLRELLQIHADAQAHTELEEELTTLEEEQSKLKEAYLMVIKEEQDIQFNREIDEHKDIIQKIYDEELVKKTAQLELELTKSITSELTEKLTRELSKRIEAETIRKEEERIRRQLQEELTQKIKDDVTEKLTLKLTYKIQKELEQKFSQKSGRSDEEQRRQMEMLKVQNQRSTESSGNNQTTQNLEDLMQIQDEEFEDEVIEDQQDQHRVSSLITSEESGDEMKKQATDKHFQGFETGQADENEQTLKLFKSERDQFKMEMMKGVMKKKQIEAAAMTQKQVVVHQEPEKIEVVRNNQQSSGNNNGCSEPSGQSDEWDSSANEELGQYQFNDEMAMQDDEAEFFNHLQERENLQRQLEQLERTSSERKREEEDEDFYQDSQRFVSNLGPGFNRNSVFELKGSKTASGERYYRRDQTEDDLEEEKIPEGQQMQDEEEYEDDENKKTPRKSRPGTMLDEQDEQGIFNQDQGIQSRPSSSTTQFQGFQGQAVQGNSGQGQAKAGMFNSNLHGSQSIQRQSFGQGFQGNQEYQLFAQPREEQKGEEASAVEEPRPSSLIDDPEDFNSFFKGLQQQAVTESKLEREGPSQDMLEEQEEDYEHQLDSTKGLRTMISAMKNDSNDIIEIQELLDRTENQDRDSGDIIPSQQDDFNDSDGDFLDEYEEFVNDRDPENEEVYDYFLDTQKDENQNDNQGYHIIDQDDLRKTEEDFDDEDLDQIQDEELREYRYNNMLEELKETFEEEEGQGNPSLN